MLVPGVTMKVDDDDRCFFYVTIDGPKGSPYEGGKFKLHIRKPDDYSLEAPFVEFQTKIYSIHVDKRGK